MDLSAHTFSCQYFNPSLGDLYKVSNLSGPYLSTFSVIPSLYPCSDPSVNSLSGPPFVNFSVVLSVNPSSGPILSNNLGVDMPLSALKR